MRATFLFTLFSLVTLGSSSCGKQAYCIRCVDSTFLGSPIEGCSDDLSELEATRAEFEAIGYTCVIFEPI